MAKKLILLLLLIPIIVMISLFAATKTISIIVDVPVSGISVSDAGSHIYLNMDNDETHSLEYTVYPTNAKNKEISATTESVSGKNTAELDFTVEDGKVKITPKSIGSAKVYLTTAEGGYRASVTVHVESENARKLQSIDCTLSDADGELEIGESATINTVMTPEEPLNPILHYSSDNPLVATVNDKGEVTALRSGAANITVRADADEKIFRIIPIVVKSSATASIIKPGDFSELSASGSFSFNVPESVTITNINSVKLSAFTTDKNGNTVDLSGKIKLTLDVTSSEGSTYYTIRYEITDPTFSGSYKISASYTDEFNSFEATLNEECEKLSKDDVNLTISFDNGTEIHTTPGSSLSRTFSFTPGSYDDYVWSAAAVGNSGVLSNVNVNGSKITFKSLKAGVGEIKLTATLKIDASIKAEATLTVFVSPTGFSITSDLLENASDTVEGIFTLGKYEYAEASQSSSTVILTEGTANRLKLDHVFSTAYATDPSFAANLKWEVMGDAAKCITIESDGRVRFIDETDSFDGVAEICATFGGKTLSSCKVRLVSGGINVYSYLDLYRATVIPTSNGAYRSVVLRNTIKDDFGKGVDKPYTEIQTTYDIRYYENVYGKNTEEFYENTKIKILIEFRSNVYGNGHEINAHNIAYGLDDTGALKNDALFRGPLNFVAMSDNNSPMSVSVKGQDNVCFAVYENTTINNVTLRGCTPATDKGLDLTCLDYTGTVVEIFGNDTTIEYSRINYGRTVIRAFGDVNDPEKEINVDIRNSVLSEAREFIMRVGSNRFADGSYDDPAPTLSGAAGNTHLNKSAYNSASFDRAAYDDAFVNTFITIENSVFRNTGLFAIGIDSHFASKALADGNNLVYSGDLISAAAALFKLENNKSLIDTWLGLAKTSYGAKVKLVGEVDLYTWKPIEDVDSSTIIETPSGVSSNTNFGSLVSKLNFNVKNMLKSYNSKLVNRPTLITGENLVHGGIVFFGGGRNYGALDITESVGQTKNIPIFEVSFSDIGLEYAYLAYAAGDEPFYFAMYDSALYKANGDDSTIYKRSQLND